MVELIENYRINNDQTVTTPAGTFYAEQRNCGFVDNDGAWIITQLPELYWSEGGCLRRRRPGRRVGIFPDATTAAEAIEASEQQPVADQMVESMGWASC